MKLNIFCTTKEMVSKLNRPPQNGRKYLLAMYQNKELITRIYRELKKLNSPKINQSIKEVGN
jgi:hypothetical protein